MLKPKLIRITTIPLSLEKLLENQLSFMKAHFEVTAVSSDKERLARFGRDQGIATFHLEMTRKITPIQDMRSLIKLYHFLRKEKPEFVHTHTPKAGIVGMLAAYFARVPHRLHTVAGLPLMEATGLKRWLLNTIEKLTYRCATRVYPNSNGLKDFIISERFTSEDKVSIIGKGSSNGVDTQYFSNDHFSEVEIQSKKQELGIPDSDFIYVFVGRIVKDKGINELVTAFLGVQKETPTSTLLLVGPFEKDLDPVTPETTQEISANPKIVTTGFVTDVRLYLAISNVLVFPSYREGFPNVVMQAGAMGLAAIVSNINGCNEIITHEVNGLIVAVKDTLRLQKAMQRIASDSELLSRLSESSRDRMVQQFERREIWQALLKEYQELSSGV